MVSLRVFLILILFLSCSTKNEDLGKRIADYSKKNDCRNQECLFYMRDLTWFKWDTLQFSEDESGLHCDFKNKGKVVYTYLKVNTFDPPSGLQFGFGNMGLSNSYTYQNCEFKLKEEGGSDDFKSKVYFILPPH